jgi:hypothetical protein
MQALAAGAACCAKQEMARRTTKRAVGKTARNLIGSSVFVMYGAAGAAGDESPGRKTA